MIINPTRVHKGKFTENDVTSRHFVTAQEGGHESEQDIGTAAGVAIHRHIDLTQVPAVPWAWVDEHVYAAIRGCSVKVLQNERRLNIGCSFRRINGTTIRYKLGDIAAFMESQPGGGAAAKPTNQSRPEPGRPRRTSP